MRAFGIDLVVDLTREIINVGIKNVSRTVLIKVFTKVAYDWVDCMNLV